MDLAKETISDGDCRLALLHEFPQDHLPFLKGDFQQVGHVLEYVRHNEDFVLQVGIVKMMLADWSR